MTLRVAPIGVDAFPGWSAGIRERLAAQRVDAGTWAAGQAAGRAAELFAKLLPEGLGSVGHRVWTLEQGPARVGTAWLRLEDTASGVDGFLFDVAVEAGRSASDLGAAVMAAVEAAAASCGVSTMRVNVFDRDTATGALLSGRGYAPAATQMSLDLTQPALDHAGPPAPSIKLRLMTVAEYAAFRVDQQAVYADELRDSGLAAPEAAAARAAAELVELLPVAGPPAGHLLWTAWAADRAVGHLWLAVDDHHDGPRAFVYDIAVTADARRRGYGRVIMQAAEQMARDRGCTSIGLSVFGFNHPARALYDALGYQPTETLLRKTL